jgi:two-component system, cell cycle sensor histidine kinase and response regulator CckA
VDRIRPPGEVELPRRQAVPERNGAAFRLVALTPLESSRPVVSQGSRYVTSRIRAALGEQNFEDLIEGLDVIVWEAAPATLQFTYVNRRAEDVLGYPVEQWIEDPNFWADHIYEADRAGAVDYCGNAIRQLRDHTFEYRMVAADGRLVWLRDIVKVEHDGANAVRLRGVMEDITDRKAAEQELRETRQALQENRDRLRAIMDHATASIYARDLEGRYLFVNRTWEEVNGRSAEEAIGHRPDELFAPDVAARYVRHDDRVIATGDPVEYEASFRVDGRLRTFMAVKFPLRNGDNRIYGVGSISNDVTARRELEEQLRQSQKMEAIGRLAGGIAHDFNNLLAVILNYAYFIRGHEAMPSDVLEDADEILSAAQRATSLTHQLLVFGRREIANPSVVDVNDVVTEIQRLLRRSIGESIALETRLDSELEPVRIDRGQLSQVLINLALNSRDAMPGGGWLRITTANVDLDAEAANRLGLSDGRFVRLVVSDSGSGMEPEVVRHAFEPFFTTKGRGEGTGLGLATVYSIVEGAGGHVAIHSERDKGTEVVTHLPVTEDREPEREPVVEKRAAQGGGTVLVVEDEASLRRLIVRMLTRGGYRVIEAADGSEALARCEREESVDVLLTDVVLPGMSGPEVADSLRRLRADVKVLYMSGYPQEVVASQGALDAPLVEKPFTADDLLRRIGEVRGD